MMCEPCVLDDMTSAIRLNFPVSRSLQNQKMCCPASTHSVTAGNSTSTTALDCVSSACSPSKVKAEHHRVTQAAALIWSPARDIENDQHSLSRQHDKTTKPTVNVSSQR